MTQSTLQLQRVTGYNALKLICQHEIDEHDLHPVMQEIVAYLDNAHEPMYLLVDLQQSPEFPIGITTYELLTGPAKHPMMGKWLLVGSSPSAHLVEDLMVVEGGRDHQLWFKTETDAIAYLDSLTSGNS